MTVLEGMATTYKRLGCNILAVTAERPEESTFQSSPEITMITDPTNEFGKQLNLTYNAKEEITKIYKELGIDEPLEGYYENRELNVPTTLIIEKGRILYKYSKRDYTQRAPSSEILRELSCLNEKPFNS